MLSPTFDRTLRTPRTQASEGFSELEALWLKNEPAQPLAPNTQENPLLANKKQRGHWEKFWHRVDELSRSRITMLATGLIAVLTACHYLEHGSATDNTATETASAAKLTPDQSKYPAQINYYEQQGNLVIDLNRGAYSLTVRDYNDHQNWDHPLPAPGDTAFIEDNTIYQYYSSIQSFQYNQGVPDNAGAAAQANVKMGENPEGKTVTFFNKYINEPSYMQPGEYPQYSDWFGNLDLGDVNQVQADLMQKWSDYAGQSGWSEIKNPADLEKLSTWQLMQLVQVAGAELEYRTEFAGVFGNYNKQAAEEHNLLTISELLADNTGVCRDVERLNLSSYQVLDEQLDLRARGLVYLPLGDLTDAMHTRGMFVLATDQSNVDIFGVDTTNLEQGLSNSAAHSSPADVAAWHGQEFGKDFLLTPADAVAYYSHIYNEYGADLDPTPLALVQRELFTAKVRWALETKNQGEYHERLVQAYEFLNQQLEREAVEKGEYLWLPMRIIPMYDQLLTIARECDLGQAEPLYTARAAKAYTDYLTEQGIEDPTEAQKMIVAVFKADPSNRQSMIDKLVALVNQLPANKS